MQRRRYLSALGTATVSPLIGHVGAHQSTEDDEFPCSPADEAVETEGGDPEIHVQDHGITVEENFTEYTERRLILPADAEIPGETTGSSSGTDRRSNDDRPPTASEPSPGDS